MNLNSSKLIKATIYTVLFQILIGSSGATAQSIRISPRNLNVLNEKVKCTYPSSSALCVCPGSCMTQVGNTTDCALKKCYAWNENLSACEETGKKFITPLVLQAIPFTGVFGAGFGNIGRWDLFGMYMGVLFGGCCFVALSTACCAACTNSGESEAQSLTACTSCWYSIALTALYIWGIVKTATPGDILDGSGCPLSGF